MIGADSCTNNNEFDEEEVCVDHEINHEINEVSSNGGVPSTASNTNKMKGGFHMKREEMV